MSELERLKNQVRELSEVIRARGDQHNLDIKRLKIAMSMVTPEQSKAIVKAWTDMREEHIKDLMGQEGWDELNRRVGNWSSNLDKVYDPDET